MKLPAGTMLDAQQSSGLLDPHVLGRPEQLVGLTARPPPVLPPGVVTPLPARAPINPLKTHRFVDAEVPIVRPVADGARSGPPTHRKKRGADGARAAAGPGRQPGEPLRRARR